MNNHRCIDELIEETGSDATFEKSFWHQSDDGKLTFTWIINLYRYTPGLNISMKRGRMILNFCPICGKAMNDRDEEGEGEHK